MIRSALRLCMLLLATSLSASPASSAHAAAFTHRSPASCATSFEDAAPRSDAPLLGAPHALISTVSAVAPNVTTSRDQDLRRRTRTLHAYRTPLLRVEQIDIALRLPRFATTSTAARAGLTRWGTTTPPPLFR